MASLTLSRLSRYKDTPVFQAGDFVEFGLWEPPAEFQTQPAGSQIHTVKAHEVGFLDILAARYYGDGYEELWWSIAAANGIIDQERDMYPGMKLVIPPDARRARFVGRGGLASAV